MPPSTRIGLFAVLGISLLSSSAYAAGSAGQPSICNRSCWGARAPSASITQMSSLNRAVVHHTAGDSDFNVTTIDQSKANVRAIQNMHMDSKGWSDIGYHFLVDKLGNIFEGRSGSMGSLPRGAHDSTNTNSFGFNVMGNFVPGHQTPTAPQLSSLYSVVAWRMPNPFTGFGSGSYAGRTCGYICSHRDCYATVCPGDNMYAKIGTNYTGGEMRTAVKARIDGAQPVYPADGLYELIACHDNKVLDDPSGSRTAGTNVWQWSVNGTDPQLWRLIAAGGGYYRIQSVCSGLYLDVQNGNSADGTPLQINYLNTTWAAPQLFRFEQGGPGVCIVNQATGTLVDVKYGGTDDGTQVWMYHNTGGTGQRWILMPVAFSSGEFEFSARHSSKALDVPYGSATPGTSLWQWTRNGGDAQHWTATRRYNNWYTIMNTATGRFLDVQNGSSGNGTPLQINYENTSWQAPQLFSFTVADPSVGSWKVTNQASGTVWDVNNGGTGDGTQVWMWPWNGSAGQQWYALRLVSNGTYELQNVNSGKVLGIQNGSATAGAITTQENVTHAASTRWVVTHTGGGAYSLTNVNSGLRLDLSNGSTAPGTAIGQTYENTTWPDPQRWSFDCVNWENQYWRIWNRSGGSGNCMDVKEASTAAGAQVWQWSNNGGANQQWIFSKIN